MFEKLRRALDIAGNEVWIVERNGSEYKVGTDGSIKFLRPAKLFGPDGAQLIPEGKGFYRTSYGTRYQLAD